MIGVYKIELNVKCYVGSSQNIKKRWQNHLSKLRKNIHSNLHLQNAFNKYGEELLEFSILEIVEIPEDVIVLEQKYIDELQPEYNIRKIAKSNLGLKASDETKQKMKEVQSKREKCSDETKQKMSIALLGNKNGLGNKSGLGKKLSEEHKKKISIASSIANSSYEVRKKISIALLGHKVSEETREKISIAHLGKKHTEETKQKLRKINLGKKRGVKDGQ